MKLLAYQKANFSSPIITVHEALRLRRQYPEEWEGKHFYDLIKLRPMMPVDRGAKSSSFAYLGGSGDGHGKGSKGIAHELVQEYVCKLLTWRIRLFGKEFVLTIDETSDEWPVHDDRSGLNYSVDCQLVLSPDSDLYHETSGVIGIEVTDTHKTGPRKKKALARAGLVILELQMIPDWHVANDVKITSEDLNQLRKRIFGFLNKGTRLGCLCKPAYVRI